ncbi:ABC transporter permease [Oerskovia rustica]|uniref:Molybdate ABC transporter permease subunit n=1 Tax=Oerskovia rustica TaxID=2762237 RepID=A0ABR8RWL6_9CELL|nr:ABC transporter permease [Oerskovia rustica]MBD7952180.1 molybdate ABC transporter permease subunit [Oerskovia rustica]
MRGLPRWVLAPAILGALFVVVPVVAMVARLDVSGGLGGIWDLLTSPTATDALWLSVRTSLVATVCCVLLGAPMALVLARTTFPGQRVARALVLLPLVLPPVVGGIALLHTFGRRGLIGQHLSVLGIEVAFTTTAVVMAQTFVALPFLVLSLEGSLRTHDARYEEVAATLGASPSTVLRRVTLPLVLPGLVSGAVLAFARALGEFGATITFAGALQGVTQTLPLEIYLQRSADPDAAVALSLLLVVVAVIVTAAVHGGPFGREPSAEGDRQRAEGDGLPTEGDRIPADDDGARHRRRVGTSPSAGEPVTLGAPLRVRVRLAARAVDLAHAVEPGQVVAVLGPNGGGKSTLLQAVTGLLPHRPRPRSGSPDELHVSIDDTVLTDTTRGTAVPPRRRRIGWLTQRPLLFAHLDAVDDVAFGLRARGTTRPEARATARERLAELDAEHLAGRRPHELSGGQAQRVSIARALATDPRVLLLDEPLASLDVGVAQQVRRALHDAQRAHPRTTLLVTHDLLDVLLLADRAVVLEGGRVVEDGPAREVLTRPRSRFAARLAGINLLSGTATDDGGLRLGAGGDAATGPSGANTTSTLAAMQVVAGVVADGAGIVVGDPAVAMFEPRAVAIHREAPSGSPRNAFAVTITSLEPHGQLFRAWGEVTGPREVRDAVGHLAADLTPRSVADLRLAPGERVWFAVKAAEVQVYSTR